MVIAVGILWVIASCLTVVFLLIRATCPPGQWPEPMPWRLTHRR